MTDNDDLSDIQNRARAQRLVRVFERFVEALSERAGERHANQVAVNHDRLNGRTIEQSPERFIEDNLIAPSAEVLGYDIRFRPKGFEGLEGRIPDFTMLNLGSTNFGEVKTPGSIMSAREESVEYLNMAQDRPLAGFATDGFVWILYTATERQERPSYTNHVTLHTFVKRIWIEQNYDEADRRDRKSLRELASDFVSEFNRETVSRKIK